MRSTVLAFLAANLIAGGAAWDHHNMSAIFDFNQRVTQTRTLAEIDWRNPHVHRVMSDERHDLPMCGTVTSHPVGHNPERFSSLTR